MSYGELLVTLSSCPFVSFWCDFGGTIGQNLSANLIFVMRIVIYLGGSLILGKTIDVASV